MQRASSVRFSTLSRELRTKKVLLGKIGPAEAARAYAAANRRGVDLIVELVPRHALDCDLEPADSYVYATNDDGVGQLEQEREAAG